MSNYFRNLGFRYHMTLTRSKRNSNLTYKVDVATGVKLLRIVNFERSLIGSLIYTERKKKRIFTLVVICIKDVLIVYMNLCLKC